MTGFTKKLDELANIQNLIKELNANSNKTLIFT